VAKGKAEIREKIESTSISVRNCNGLDELRACVRLQQEVWNFSDADLVPLRMFVVAEKIGGQAIGAFDSGQLVGFSLSLPAIHDGKSYLHSHMLAVDEKHRNTGLGKRLKLFQREDAMARGFDLIEWTFDPLEIKNAYFNIEKLGAISRRYSANQYGISSSPLQGGLPTDRLIAEWWLKSERVNAALAGGRQKFACAEKIPVPAEIYEWKAAENTRWRAHDLQQKNREQFLAAFASGSAVLGYECDEQGNGAFLLGKWLSGEPTERPREKA
jgi:predicted GNAT superfamily acetyltransferase